MAMLQVLILPNTKDAISFMTYIKENGYSHVITKTNIVAGGGLEHTVEIECSEQDAIILKLMFPGVRNDR